MAASGIALLSGCVGGAARGTPLYPSRGTAPPIETVAQLYGEVATVDGVSVSGAGKSFELLPGCHVVTTRTSWGERESTLTLSGNMRQQIYVIEMHANHSYVIEYDLASRTGNGGRVTIRARERDANGRSIVELSPTTDPKAVEACRKRAAS